MIRWCDNGHAPTRVESGRRCRVCASMREATRPSRQARGYGAQHVAARRMLEAQLPRPCGYATDPRCPASLIVPGADWVAAHAVDGRPEYGWMPAHRACNERAKVRGGGGSLGADALRKGPAPRSVGRGSGSDKASFP